MNSLLLLDSLLKLFPYIILQLLSLMREVIALFVINGWHNLLVQVVDALCELASLVPRAELETLIVQLPVKDGLAVLFRDLSHGKTAEESVLEHYSLH